MCGAASVLVALASGGVVGLDRLLFDLTLAAHHALGIGVRDSDGHVAIVAIDERTLIAPELRDIPRVFFGPAFARMLDAVLAGGAKAVGFDALFAYDSTRIDPQLDASFRDALARHGRRVVIGRSARMSPVLPILLSVPENSVAFLELPRDPDGVTRQMPAELPTVSGERVPTLAARLVERAGGLMPDLIRLAPAWHLETMPAYGLVDVLRCAENVEVLRAAFADKVVLVGTTLPEEDRRLAPSRFIPAPIASPQAEAKANGCRLNQLPSSDQDSSTVPGVFLHAAAVDAALAGRNLAVATVWQNMMLSGLAAVVGAGISVSATLVVTFTVLAFCVIALVVVSGALLAVGFWFPVSVAAVALPTSAGLGYVARYLFEERRRRWIQQTFHHYLAPAIVDELATSETLPEVGGERRDVTVMFADLSGFTALSGLVSPQVLMRTTNRYLALITEEVAATGGYVDKFIGDAVMAIWGAPALDADHAEHAVTAAINISNRIMESRLEALAHGEEGFWIKMGLNSGEAIIGNVGSAKRLSYTAVGETVNLAARFESLPGDYGCMIVIGERTAEALNDSIRTCELDYIKVKGKTESVRIYEPFITESGVDEYVAGYTRALMGYRERRFKEAQQMWLGLHYPGLIDPKHPTTDGGDAATPARVMARRASGFLVDPPPIDWQGEWVKDSK